MKRLKFKMRNDKKGITLIALVITIIVLLILAGVTIATLTGDNGILPKTLTAKKLNQVSSEKEVIEIIATSNQINNKIGESNDTINIGISLYDKNIINNSKWHVIQLLDSKKIYGTGWNYIKKDTNVEGYGETEFEWLVNYNTGEVIQLEENKYVELSYSVDLAEKDGIILNIDAKNMTDENWEGVSVHGDVQYNSSSKGLYFDGEGDYLEIITPGDFSDGFTFEIYTNLERLRYDNGSGYRCSALFCRMPSLDSDFDRAMKFGLLQWWPDREDELGIGRFSNVSSFAGVGKNLSTTNNGGILVKEYGYKENENVYITFVYTVYDANKSEEYKKSHYDEKMIKENLDKVEYFVNGKSLGYTYYGKEGYKSGLNMWNHDNCPFFVGVCPFWKNNNLYYLKGNVYSCRLYNKSLTSQQVLDNCNKTMAYHEIQ